MKTTDIKTYLMAIAAMSFWGMSYVWVKIVYEFYNPITTVFLRLFFATILLVAVKYLFKIGLTPRKGDMKYLVLLSVAEPFLYFLGESFGLQRISSTLAAVMVSTIPLFAMLAARLLFHEKMSIVNTIGVFISFAGILVMVLEPDFSLKEDPVGIMLMLVAVFSAVVYTMMVKKLSETYKPITILTWQNIYGTILFLPLFLLFDYQSFIKVPFQWPLVFTLAQLVIFASILAFFFFITVIEKIGIARANVFTNFVPVVTAVSAWFILPDEHFSIKTFVGVFVVIVGIYFSQRKPKTLIILKD
ncbi:MAG: EamA family transporter [Bacteroidales bacterium]|nr:EamA family transporter [Bacteroidales bacterium]